MTPISCPATFGLKVAGEPDQNRILALLDLRPAAALLPEGTGAIALSLSAEDSHDVRLTIASSKVVDDALRRIAAEAPDAPPPEILIDAVDHLCAQLDAVLDKLPPRPGPAPTLRCGFRRPNLFIIQAGPLRTGSIEFWSRHRDPAADHHPD